MAALAHRQPLCQGAATPAADVAALTSTTLQVAVLASGASARKRRPYGLLHLWAAAAPYGLALAAAGRPPLQGALAAAWPWAAGPAWGLTVASCPSSSL
ncbi:hypothetical protein BHE74_00056991 [Ensete ventricosum]|nr:hypothetical protein BHE74_00056991 [Ensete ventricosum]